MRNRAHGAIALASAVLLLPALTIPAVSQDVPEDVTPAEVGAASEPIIATAEADAVVASVEPSVPAIQTEAAEEVQVGPTSSEVPVAVASEPVAVAEATTEVPVAVAEATTSVPVAVAEATTEVQVIAGDEDTVIVQYPPQEAEVTAETETETTTETETSVTTETETETTTETETVTTTSMEPISTLEPVETTEETTLVEADPPTREPGFAADPAESLPWEDATDDFYPIASHEVTQTSDVSTQAAEESDNGFPRSLDNETSTSASTSEREPLMPGSSPSVVVRSTQSTVRSTAPTVTSAQSQSQSQSSEHATSSAVRSSTSAASASSSLRQRPMEQRAQERAAYDGVATIQEEVQETETSHGFFDRVVRLATPDRLDGFMRNAMLYNALALSVAGIGFGTLWWIRRRR